MPASNSAPGNPPTGLALPNIESLYAALEPYARGLLRGTAVEGLDHQDIVQMTLEKLLVQDKANGAVSQLSGPVLRRYAQVALKNSTTSLFRSSRTIPFEQIEDKVPVEVEFDSGLESTELIALLGEMMARGTEGQRNNVLAAVLHHAFAYRQSEIAQLTEQKLGTVKARIHKGVEEIRNNPEIARLAQRLGFLVVR